MACFLEKNWKYIQNHMLGTNCFVLIYLYMLDIDFKAGHCVQVTALVGLRVSQPHYRSLLQISTNAGWVWTFTNIQVSHKKRAPGSSGFMSGRSEKSLL